MRSLAERLQAYEQQKARLASVEAKLKLAEKKARTRRLIQIGLAAEKAGLISLDEETVYGAMLSLNLNDEKQLRQWATDGGNALAREKQASNQSREPVVLTFPKSPAPETVAALRSNGFRFNRVLRHWEGLACFEEAEKLAAAHGGAAQKVAV